MRRRDAFLFGLLLAGIVATMSGPGAGLALAADEDDDEDEEEEDEEDPACRRILTAYKALGKQGGETTLSFDKSFQELWMPALESLSEGHYTMTGSSREDGFVTGVRTFKSHDDTMTIVVTDGKPAKVRMKIARETKTLFALGVSYERLLCDMFKLFEARLGATGHN